jgi:diaminohydroxyphosphoribosylaminopyrimidine deaminase / 5-amino-6-(5-phosphoribosylamino)uracil reductase
MGHVTRLGHDNRVMAAAVALAERGRARTGANPNVGCIIVKDGLVIGRGWTQSGGRPHAEAMALAQAGKAVRGATIYVSLEPCAHDSQRGPSCADSLINAGVARVVVAIKDPDLRTNGQGIARLEGAGIAVTVGVCAAAARASMVGWLSQIEKQRPYVTLKLATSLDGCIAREDGESKWITGDAARAHVHLERSRQTMILVGRGTYETDQPGLDVRLAGLEGRAPIRAILTHGAAPPGWTRVSAPTEIHSFSAVHYLLVEGGAQTAASFLQAGLVDRILLYRAPLLIGAGKASLGDIGLNALGDAHGRWRRTDIRQLGKDSVEVYEHTREAE